MLLCLSNIDMHVEKKSYSWQGFEIVNPSHFVEFAKTISVNVTLTKHQKERHMDNFKNLFWSNLCQRKYFFLITITIMFYEYIMGDYTLA